KAMTLAGVADRGEDATRVYAINKPDVVLISEVLPGAIDGLEATRRLREVFPKAKIVLLVSCPSAETLYHALQGGVSAILPIEMPTAQMIPILAQVHAQDICWIDPRLARLLPSLLRAPSTTLAGAQSSSKAFKKASFSMNIPSQEAFLASENLVATEQAFSNLPPVGATPQKRFASATTPSAGMSGISLPEAGVSHGLTGREVDVLKLITEGRTNQDIARHLVITQNTVKTHMKNIFQKLGVCDRTGAAVKALRENLLT
ncbi:MAG: response regulator transcription factor, partial [Vampirovibrionales bacterium]|nr:response regulator transcription factor [Vampirovibrionales bacterium]